MYIYICNAKEVITNFVSILQVIFCINLFKTKPSLEVVGVINLACWKQKLYNHRHTFDNPLLKNQTALSIYVRSLKECRKKKKKLK